MCSDKHGASNPDARAAVKSGLSSIRYAIRHHSLLEKHTNILVGVSGGIDSLVLLFLLHKYREVYQQAWEIQACHIDTGFPDWDPGGITECLTGCGIESHVVKSNIYRRICAADDKCFFCSRHRRKKLMEFAEEMNFTNIALAHHQEDAVETLLLNMLYAGRMSTLLPRQFIVHGRFVFVRPLFFLNKRTINRIAQAFKLKSHGNPCPFYGNSRRELIRDLLGKIRRKNPDVYSNIFSSMFNIKKQYMPS